MEKQREDMALCISEHLRFPTHSPRVAVTGHRSNGPIVGVCNDRVVLPNGPEAALLAFLGVSAAVRG
jgi:hypothetical protein